MHLNQDISKALQVLEHIKSDISDAGDERLERDTLCDLQLLISALENPALRGQAVLQDSMHELRQQLLKDPQLSADGFDITFAGRLLLDDGHYSEPVYESPEDDDKNGFIGSGAPEERSRNGAAETKQKHHKKAPAGVQKALPTPPVLSIPIPTTPVLMPPSRSPAILLQIPLLAAEEAAKAGLTINDLYLGRLTPEVGALDDGMAMFRASSGDSDRSPNGSQTSLNSGWSKSSSIVQLNCEEDERRRGCAGGDVLKINPGCAQYNPPTKQPQRVETTPTLAEHNQLPTAVSPLTHTAPHPHDHAHRSHHRPADESDDEDDDDDTRWADAVMIVELVKGTRGLGFSVCERGRGRCVVGNLVEGGAAKTDGRLRPGDRLLSVNGRPLAGGGLDEAVLALRGAPCGPVTIGVRRRADRRDDDHYEEIEGGKEARGEGRNGNTQQRDRMPGVVTHAEVAQVHAANDEDANGERREEQYEARAELHLKRVRTQQDEKGDQASLHLKRVQTQQEERGEQATLRLKRVQAEQEDIIERAECD